MSTKKEKLFKEKVHIHKNSGLVVQSKTSKINETNNTYNPSYPCKIKSLKTQLKFMNIHGSNLNFFFGFVHNFRFLVSTYPWLDFFLTAELLSLFTNYERFARNRAIYDS